MGTLVGKRLGLLWLLWCEPSVKKPMSNKSLELNCATGAESPGSQTPSDSGTPRPSTTENS